jgi:hypothetical protein
MLSVYWSTQRSSSTAEGNSMGKRTCCTPGRVQVAQSLFPRARVAEFAVRFDH